MNKIKVIYDAARKIKDSEKVKGSVNVEVVKDQVKVFNLYHAFEKNKSSEHPDFHGHFHGHFHEHFRRQHGMGMKNGYDKLVTMLGILSSVKLDELEDGSAVLSLESADIPEDIRQAIQEKMKEGFHERHEQMEEHLKQMHEQFGEKLQQDGELAERLKQHGDFAAHLKLHEELMAHFGQHGGFAGRCRTGVGPEDYGRPQEGFAGCCMPNADFMNHPHPPFLKELKDITDASFSLRVFINAGKELEKAELTVSGKKKDEKGAEQDVKLTAELKLDWKA